MCPSIYVGNRVTCDHLTCTQSQQCLHCPINSKQLSRDEEKSWCFSPEVLVQFLEALAWNDPLCVNYSAGWIEILCSCALDNVFADTERGKVGTGWETRPVCSVISVTLWAPLSLQENSRRADLFLLLSVAWGSLRDSLYLLILGVGLLNTFMLISILFLYWDISQYRLH